MKILIWTLYLTAVEAIFHRLSMLTFTSTLPEDALFGYSIAYLPLSKSLIVGAPKADDVGQVFYIHLNSNKIEEIPNNIQKDIPQSIVAGFWLGATVRAANNFSVICAPRYTRDLLIANAQIKRNRFKTNAVCFVSTYGAFMEKLKNITFQHSKFENEMDSLGWSVDIPFEEETVEVLVGGPAMFNGRAVLYKSQYTDLAKALPTPIEYPKQKEFIYNYGYSVASGKFFADKIQYAISTTFGKKGLGKVYFFNSKRKNVATIEDTSDVGSMFGAAMCVVYLGDTRASILVGAPTYADKHTHDRGAVYLYRPSIKEKKMLRVAMIRGTFDGGYFGYAIASMGDMDGDNREEVAIGAPYEDGGRGSVYIYTGEGLIRNRGPVQVIKAEHMWNFGFSLTTSQDYDENGCNELGVGAPYANTVAVLRCMAAVTVNVTAKPPDTNLKNKTHIEFESCLEITYPQKPRVIMGDILVTVETPSSAYVIVDADHDGAQTYIVSLKGKPRTNCTRIRVHLNDDPAEKQLLAYKITAQLKDNPEEQVEFESSRIILSNYSVLLKYGRQIISSCGDRPCQPMLMTQLSKIVPTPYIIGSSDMESVSLSVSNTGETAFSPCVSLKLSYARFRHIPSDCIMKYRNVEFIVCRLNRALLNGEIWDITDITIDTKELTSANDKIVIMYETSNECKIEMNNRTAVYELALKSDMDAILLTGQTEETVSFTDNDVSQVPLLERIVYHDYIISNNGVTNWVDVKCNIRLEKGKYAKYTEGGAIEISVNSETRKNCMITDNFEEWLTYECDIDYLPRNEKAKFRISIIILPSYLGLTKNSNKTISSYMELFLKNKKQSLSITTTFTLHTAQVPLWVLIAAFSVGLLALFILALILYECGFLKRENKNKLQQLKTNIRRQTIRQSRIRESAHNALLKQIAEDAQTVVQHHNEDSHRKHV